MGGAGDPPAPVGDPPTGTAASNVAKRPCPLAQTFALVPSGESPDGTGGSPVLAASHFSNTLSGAPLECSLQVLAAVHIMRPVRRLMVGKWRLVENGTMGPRLQRSGPAGLHFFFERWPRRNGLWSRQSQSGLGRQRR